MEEEYTLESTVPAPIGAREINGLPKASMTELLEIMQDPNSCDRVG